MSIEQNGKKVTVRLACIDAPETAQSPWGEQSANKLKELLPPQKPVRVREIEKDRYGRTVAEVYVNEKSVNLEMVETGQAVVYTQYLNISCPSSKYTFPRSIASCACRKASALIGASLSCW